MSNIGKSLKEVLFDSKAAELTKEYAEIGLDALLKDGLLKDFPVLGTIIGLYNTGSSIREWHTLKKLATFLNCLDEIPENEKTEFLDRISDEDKQGELFEKLVLLLDRLDETVKAEIIGNLFRIYVMDVFDRDMFLRCSSIVERAYLGDLISFFRGEHRFINGVVAENERFNIYVKRMHEKLIKPNLINLGILNLEYIAKPARGERSNSGKMEIKTETKTSEAGRILGMFMFYDLSNPEFQKSMERIRKDFHQVREIYKEK